MRYPALYRAADVASGSAQRLYVRLAGVQLVAPSLAAVSSLLGPGWPRILAIAMFAVGVATSLAIQLRRPERAWFDGRALAESIKTMTWRYVMRVKPFEQVEPGIADQRFAERFTALIGEYRELGGTLVANQGAGPDITDEMRSLRQLATADRRDLYSKERLQDQVGWYSKEAKGNERRTVIWLWVITGLQLSGLAAALQIGGSTEGTASTGTNWIPVVAAVIAATFGWLQFRRYQELAKTYGVAALELGMLTGRIGQCDTDELLADFVEEAEEAMSREHTLWRARRT